MAGFVLDVVAPLAHEALHRVDRALRVGRAGGAAPRVRRRSCRRSPTDTRPTAPRPSPLLVADDLRHAVLDVGDQRVGGAEIDADDLAHITADPNTGHKGHQGTDCFCTRPTFVSFGVLCVEYGLTNSTLVRSRRAGCDVVALQELIAREPSTRPAAAAGVPLRRQLLQLRLVLDPLGLDRLTRALEPRPPSSSAGAPPSAQHRESRRAPRSARTPPRAAPAAPAWPPRRVRTAPAPRACSRYSDPRDRLAQRAIGVVQTRRSLEARAALGRRRVVEIVRMKLAAERPETPLEIRGSPTFSFRGSPMKAEIVAPGAQSDRIFVHCGQKCASSGAPAPQSRQA